MVEAAIGGAGTGMTPLAVGPFSGRIGPTRLIRRWGQVVRTWAKERFTGLGKPTVQFEEILHEFAQTIEVAGNAGAVEAALMRQARRMVPGCRLELIAGPALPDDQGPQGRSVDTINGGPEAPLILSHGQHGPTALDLPLRCGSACYGRLRIRMQRHGGGTVPAQTARRLTTLCTIAASTFERLGRAEEWPEHHDASDRTNHRGADLTAGGSPFADASAATARLHDATFLNAVLPFALSQARRHHEPLSLVCVAIDRLAGIQELLGRDTADQLVRSVAGTVASLIRGSDIIARLYDDRVVAVLPRAPGGGALHVAQRICQAVAANAHANCEIPNTTVSIGVATFPTSAENVFSLFDAADEALARAKPGTKPGVPCPSARGTHDPSGAAHGLCVVTTSPYLMNDDLVMGGIVRPGTPDTHDAVAWAYQAPLLTPVEHKGAQLIAAGDIGPGKRRHSPVEGHRTDRLGVFGDGDRRGGVTMLGEHERRAAGRGRDEQQGCVQAPGYQAGRLDDAFRDRLHASGPRDAVILAWAVSVAGRAGQFATDQVQGAPDLNSENNNLSASSAIWLIMATASTGYSPMAVSPESITASVPSSTALKTSLASARVGRLLDSMLLSIWVAVITGTRAR